MNGDDLVEVVGAIGLFALLITVIVLVVTQVGASWRAKAQLAREQEFRSLTEKAVAAQEGTERQLAQMSDRLADLQGRIDSIERVLKDVE